MVMKKTASFRGLRQQFSFCNEWEFNLKNGQIVLRYKTTWRRYDNNLTIFLP
jgi:hypothetical protein